MKRIILLVLIAVCSVANAQTYDEWVRQKKTQKKYLLEQIAALRTYGSYAVKGYSIVKGGLNAIQQIKRGDLKLHEQFFESLGLVSPGVRKYSKVGEIIGMQVRIAGSVTSALKRWRAGDQLTASEISYFETVMNRLLDDCIKTLDELYVVISNTKLEMKDDERLKRIDLLHGDMIEQKIFLESFCASVNGVVMQRKLEANEVKVSKQLNGLR